MLSAGQDVQVPHEFLRSGGPRVGWIIRVHSCSSSCMGANATSTYAKAHRRRSGLPLCRQMIVPFGDHLIYPRHLQSCTTTERQCTTAERNWRQRRVTRNRRTCNTL